MIIKFKAKPTDSSYYLAKFRRWVLEFTWGMPFHLYEEVLLFDDNEFVYGVRYYSFSFKKQLKWGADHMWYDGPHCSFSIGPIMFSWSGDFCQKCYDELYGNNEDGKLIK